MPYVFAFLLLLNIGALGYFLFVHDTNADTSTVAEAKAQIEYTVEITNPNKKN